MDNVSRRAFDNFSEFEELYGDRPEMRELSYPRASNARHLPERIRNRLGIGAERKSLAWKTGRTLLPSRYPPSGLGGQFEAIRCTFRHEQYIPCDRVCGNRIGMTAFCLSGMCN